MAKYGLALGVLIFAAYSNSFSADLVVDSAVLIKQDPRIREVTSENISNILTHGYWWPSYESNLYRPVTTGTFLINYALLDNRDRPGGYHLINVLLHWLNAWLVLLIVRRIAGRLDIAMVAAGLWALHPINTEVVTYVAGRADLLATLSVLLGGWCYLNAVRSTGAARIAWLAGLGVNALWGVFAKENAVTILAFVALSSRASFSLAATKKEAWLGFLAACVALFPAFVTMWIVRGRVSTAATTFSQVFVDNPIFGATNWLQAKMTAISVIGRDLLLLVWPATLSNDYSYNQIPLFGTTTAATALAWISLAVIAGAIALAIALRQKAPVLGWGIGFLFLMMLPTSNLIVTIGSIMAERFMYLPAIGFCVVAALTLSWIGARQRWVAAGIAVAVLVAFGARTYARNADWQSERALWASAVEAAPDSFKVYKGNATAVWANGAGTGERELDQAIALAERGVAILDRTPLSNDQQDGALFLDLGQYYRLKGEALAQGGRLDDATPFFQKAVATLVRARTADRWTNESARKEAVARGESATAIPDRGNFNIYVQLGASYLDLHNWTEAESAARYAMRLQPLDASAYRLAGMSRFNQGQAYDAGVFFTAIILMNPRDGQAWNDVMTVGQQLGLASSPVVQTAAGSTLDDRLPVVRKMIADAQATIVRQLEDAKQFEAARRYERQFHR